MRRFETVRGRPSRSDRVRDRVSVRRRPHTARPRNLLKDRYVEHGSERRVDPHLDACRADTGTYTISLLLPIGFFIWSLRTAGNVVLWLARRSSARPRAEHRSGAPSWKYKRLLSALSRPVRAPSNEARRCGLLCDTGPMAWARPLMLAGIVVSLALASCGNEDDVEPGTKVAESAGWWILDAEGFILLDGGLTSDDVADSTGHLWTLEYSNGPSTLQVSAWSKDSRFVDMVGEYPTVGVAEVAGYDVTLRRYPGEPSDDIRAAVMAVWQDGDRLIGFGGGGLSEDQARSYLEDLERVTRSEWNAAVDELPEPPPPPAPTSLGD